MRTICFFIFISLCFGVFHGLNAQELKENKGQWPSQVSFAAELAAGNIYIENTCLTYQLFSLSDIQKAHDSKRSGDIAVHGHNYKMELVGASLSKSVRGIKKKTYYNYFMGNDPRQWASNVKAYKSVFFENAYKGIDIKFYESKSGIKYDFIVRPGADLKSLKLKYHFVDQPKIKDNQLLIKTSIGEIIESIPKAYQLINGKEINVSCNYILNGDEISFSVGEEYDPAHELVIDPTVIVASYSGTESLSFGLGVKPDEKGNMYLYSLNITKNYPVTMGAVQTTFNGGFFDCALSKFNSTGTSKFFSTYIGGNKNDNIINCDVQGNQLAIFGTTSSDTFPIIQNGFQSNFSGIQDYFIIKLDTSGKMLLSSTYIGGKRAEGLGNIANGTEYYGNFPGELIMDAGYNCYFIGNTISFDFPVTPASFKPYSDSTNYGDMVIVKLNPTLTQLSWSTYFGGSYIEVAGGLKLSADGKLYCAGSTGSNNFYTTAGSAYPSKINPPDVAAFILDTLNGFPLHSTYLGSKGSDIVSRVAIDRNNNFYITATSNQPLTMTLTPGAYNSSSGNVMFIKVNNDLSQVNALARFGYASSQTKLIEIDALAVDSCGYVYFGGYGKPGLPVTPNAFKSVGATSGNMYLAVFNPNFGSLRFASYFGGPATLFEDHDDGGLNYFDSRGYFYHGTCVFGDWPVTSGAYSGYNIKDSIPNGNMPPIKNSDAFVKIDLNTFVNVTSTLGGELKSCNPITTTFIAVTNLGTVSIDPGDGTGAVNTNSLVHTYDVFGTYTAMVIAGTDTTTCNQSDSIRTIIKFGPAPVAPLPDSTNNCHGITDALNAQNDGALYYWNTGQTVQVISPYKTGKYFVTIDNGFCSILDSSYVTMLEAEYPLVLPNIITPNNDYVNDCWDLSKYAISGMDFVIYNRWGTPVYKSNTGDTKWCGLNQRGEPLSDGTYFWVLNCTSECKPQNKVTEKGFIQIAR
jgi:gliding motility-associated-like protein